MDHQLPAIPREVRIASMLLLALGAVLLISGVSGLLYRQDAVSTLADSRQSDLVSTSELSTIALVAAIAVLVLGLLLVVAGAFVRRGRQWARVLAFVAGGPVILIMVVGAVSGAGLLAVVLMAAAVGAVSCLMQASVASHFTRTPAQPPPWTP